MDCEGNMTEESKNKLNELIMTALRWLEAQAEHQEWANKDREWWAEEAAWAMVEEADQFSWLWQEEMS
ncbi:MAG: hypothetical protein CMA62_04300 [Euryarchaeota archaeon]|nr:hypothetical protein [Euryarchaeota archaeon]